MDRYRTQSGIYQNSPTTISAGDADLRTCNICGVTQPPNEFCQDRYIKKDGSVKIYDSSRCRSCRRRLAREYYHKNKGCGNRKLTDLPPPELLQYLYIGVMNIYRYIICRTPRVNQKAEQVFNKLGIRLQKAHFNQTGKYPEYAKRRTSGNSTVSN